LLADDYAVKTILTDTGSTLGGVLLNQGLVKEISLLVHPVIVGQEAHYIFRNVSSHIELKRDKCEVLDDGYLWLVYKVVK
jgi:2,5-diamino-6-(ribosylamino)-4(3H)-pyrimidinone 5'-phosphate reductase